MNYYHKWRSLNIQYGYGMEPMCICISCENLDVTNNMKYNVQYAIWNVQCAAFNMQYTLKAEADHMDLVAGAPKLPPIGDAMSQFVKDISAASPVSM